MVDLLLIMGHTRDQIVVEVDGDTSFPPHLRFLSFKEHQKRCDPAKRSLGILTVLGRSKRERKDP